MEMKTAVAMTRTLPAMAEDTSVFHDANKNAVLTLMGKYGAI